MMKTKRKIFKQKYNDFHKKGKRQKEKEGKKSTFFFSPYLQNGGKTLRSQQIM